ncbi:unnamed protein product [Rhizoctonia solani]|uniref:Uncharacterized protein n=1 Tax=Rhizoctonia solani TaxID=456999 RepID=A0A8H3GK70_9AGAM|nr:unnamed protein product [Rhizoctonia solani]
MSKKHPKRNRCAQRQEVDEATRRLRCCSYCPGLFSIYKNAWKIHEAKCKHRPGKTPGGIGVPTPMVHPAEVSESDSESNLDDLEAGPSLATSQPGGYWDRFVIHESQDEIIADFNLVEDNDDAPQYIEQDLDENGIPPLKEGQKWIKRHPASKQPSGFLISDIHGDQPTNWATHFDPLPPYFPFRSLDDFQQAEIFSDFGDTDKKINRQLGLASSNISLKNSKDYHETLAVAIQLWGGEFTTTRFTTEFEGQKFEHYIHYQPAFPALKRVVGDPDLAKYMVCYPEEQWVCRPNTNSGSMQVLEELWHAKLWWTLQNRICPNQCILYIIIYIDKTSVSTIDGVHVWPIYAWVGNLPASVCKQRTKKGGAILLGYLPKARKDSKVKDLAGF